jgi:hypothetical protein
MFEIDGLIFSDEDDIWSYICGNPVSSVRKAYKAITGHTKYKHIQFLAGYGHLNVIQNLRFSFGFCFRTNWIP